MSSTIAAIATPFGESGIGIVRISGPEAVRIANTLFKPHSGTDLNIAKSFTMNYGWIIDPATGKNVDEVLVSVMRAPKTYTREDIVEINCHGGPIPLRRTLELVLKHGAQLACPGEFTKRAFLNGRIDLAQAEAVCDLIKARTDLSSSVALKQISGGISEKINRIIGELKNLWVEIEAPVDFPEENIPELPFAEMSSRLKKVRDELDALLRSVGAGRIIREGIPVAIVGRPNVGKSSLFNALIDAERAIVTDIPGTTRDWLEEVITVDNICIRVIDTAGLRKSRNSLEKISIDRSVKIIDEAEIVLVVLDGSTRPTDKDRRIMETVNGKKKIFVINKSDLPRLISEKDIRKLEPGAKTATVSALKKTGLGKLKKAVLETALEHTNFTFEDVLTANIRHMECVNRAKQSVLRALESIGNKMSAEFIILDMKAAVDNLGEIVGKFVSEEILDSIFKGFCIGK